MAIPQKLKDNPITSITSIITTLGIILGAFMTVDNRYAHSEELNKLREEQRQVVLQNRADLMQSTNQIRKQQLEDKVFELELIARGRRTEYDDARLNKYRRDLDDIARMMR